MAYTDLTTYIAGTLATDVAAYLNDKLAHFPHATNYFLSPGDTASYFSEATIQGAMIIKLNAWATTNNVSNNVLIMPEYRYPGLTNRTDIVVVYSDAAGVRTAFIEIKANQTAESVNEDIGVLDAAAGLIGSPLTNGYAFYVVRTDNPGWKNYITDVHGAKITTVPIPVN